MDLLENFGGLKDFYKVSIKANNDFQFGNRKVLQGETIAFFDNIQIANLQEYSKIITANGGYQNPDLITWKISNGLDLQFIQGVFSKQQLPFLTQCIPSSKNQVLVSDRIKIESNEEGKINLPNEPVGLIFVTTANSVVKTTLNSFIGEPFTMYIVDYEYYCLTEEVYELGKEIRGFVSLEGRSRIKSEEDGSTKTVILKIPKMSITSNLTLRIGKDAFPIISTFSARAHITGEQREQRRFFEFYILNEDIDKEVNLDA